MQNIISLLLEIQLKDKTFASRLLTDTVHLLQFGNADIAWHKYWQENTSNSTKFTIIMPLKNKIQNNIKFKGKENNNSNKYTVHSVGPVGL